MQNRNHIIIVVIFILTFSLIAFLIYNHSIRGCEHEKVSVKKDLIERIKERKNLTQLLKKVEDVSVYQSVMEYKNEIFTLKTNLTEIIVKNNNINQFILKQNKTLYSTIVSLIRNGEFSVSRELFKDLSEFDLNAIITSVYDKNLLYVEKIMEFLNSFSNINDIIRGYRIIFNQLKINQQFSSAPITTIGYRTFSDFNENNNDNKDLLFLRTNLPDVFKFFPWNEIVLIHNVEYNENVDTANNVEAGTYDRNRREMFTYTKTDINSTNIHHQFYIIPVANGTYFYIKSKKYEEYLYLDTNDTAWDSQRRELVSFKTKNVVPPLMGKWQFENVEGTDYFKIKNIYWNEYLYAEKGFELKNFPYHRRLFTSRSGKCEYDGCMWRFVQVYE